MIVRSLYSSKAAAPPPDRPPPEAGTARAIKIATMSIVGAHLGRHMDGPATKDGVVTVLAGNRKTRFSKYSGSLEWANAIVLWVNIGGKDYNNNFLDGGAKITWYASQRFDETSPVVQRLVHSAKTEFRFGAVLNKTGTIWVYVFRIVSECFR